MAFAQFLMDCFNVFRDKLDKGQHAKKSFPQHKRFGIFVDRRESGNKHQVNEVTLFQQLASCDTIPAGSLDEWYIQAVRDCIIPGIDDTRIHYEPIIINIFFILFLLFYLFKCLY
eukprot:666984_1